MSEAWPVPIEIESLVAAIVARAAPKEIWLFGIRARGDHRPGSDWDLAVSLDKAASPDQVDPMTYRMLKKHADV